MNIPLDNIRMNQAAASKISRLSVHKCLHVIALGVMLSGLSPIQAHSADEVLTTPLATESPVLGIENTERVVNRSPTSNPAGKSKSQLSQSVEKPSLPKKSIATGEDAVISKLEFKQANMVDVVRALADMSGLNIVATEEAAKKTVTVFLQNISVKDALDTISKNSGLWYRQDKASKTFRIMSTEEYQRDMVVYREDTTRVFNLLHPNPVIVATAVRDLYGQRVLLTLGVQGDDFGTGGTGGAAGGNQARTGGLGMGVGVGAGAGQAALRRTAGVATGGVRALTGGQIGGARRESDTAISQAEKMTPDQLARLESSLQVDGDGNVISSEALKSISRTEQPIYLTVNREHNLIIVRTSDMAAIKEIERLIKEMDKPTTQVLLEMKVLELSIGDSFNQLFNMDILSSNGKERFRIGNSSIPTEVGTMIYNFLDTRIAARLELLQKNNQINTLSSPILLASNNRPARVFVGEERILVTGVTATDPVLNASGGLVTPAKITYQTELRNIGNTLNIIPKINADRTVTLSIQQDSSTVLVGAVSLPPITVGTTVQSFNIDSVKTSNIEGIVVAKDGLTVAIGGLISSSSSNDVRKVPVLGDIPLLGQLFTSKVQSTKKSELILLITPHIISTPSEGDDVSRDAVEPLTEQQW